MAEQPASNGDGPSRGESVDLVGVTKSFGAKPALSGVDLHIDPGTFLVLLGPSGSGKTTLLRCQAGIERLTEGSIYIGNRLVAGRGAHLPPERRRLAMVFQDYALWPPSSPAPGATLSMFVRPSAVRIVAPHEAQLMARVRDVAFCGRGYEHALDSDGTLLTRVFSERRWERGSAVGVRLSYEGCLVLVGEGSAPRPAGSLVDQSEPSSEEEHAHQ